MNIGEKIHELRKKKRISKSKLASKVGVSTLTMMSWEKGETAPDDFELQKIAQALNVSIDTFLDKTEYYNKTDLLTNMYDDYKEKNKFKVIIIVIVVLLLIFLIGDTLIALKLKKSPLVSFHVSYLGKESYVDKGLFMNSFYCVDEKGKTTLTQKFKISSFKCPDEKTKTNKTNKQVINIEDTSKKINNFVCSSAKERFYEDEENEYYLECTNSSYVIVTYYNDKTENIKSALESGKITIKDLDEYNIKYVTKVKPKSPVTEEPGASEYPKTEELELKDSQTFYLRKNNIEALEVEFKVDNGKLLLINKKNNAQKEIFSEEKVQSIAQRNYGSIGKAKLIILTMGGNLFISNIDINYSYGWDDDLLFEQMEGQDIVSLKVEKNSEEDVNGNLIAVDKDGNEKYLKEVLD